MIFFSIIDASLSVGPCHQTKSRTAVYSGKRRGMYNNSSSIMV